MINSQTTHVASPLDSRDKGSTVREPAVARANAKLDPESSREQRLEHKLVAAAALLARLEPQDARARLLHVAMLRRDEALLDGILAELALPTRRSQRSR